MRERLTQSALRIARGARYDSLGTFEFLVDADGGDDAGYAFIEANPRLQVEHTVTEEVTGVDLVQAQLQLAAGQSLAELGLRQARYRPAARLCDSAPNQRRIDGRGRRRAPLGRQAQRFRAALGTGCPRRYLRLYRLHHQSQVRLAAGQAHRAFVFAQFCRRRQQGVSRPVRVPHRRRGHQPGLSPDPAEASRFRGASDPHPVRRAANR